MYLFAFGNRRQPCISVKHVLKCSNAICEWPELSILIKSVVLYCIVLYVYQKRTLGLCELMYQLIRIKKNILLTAINEWSEF